MHVLLPSHHRSVAAAMTAITSTWSCLSRQPLVHSTIGTYQLLFLLEQDERRECVDNAFECCRMCHSAGSCQSRTVTCHCSDEPPELTRFRACATDRPDYATHHLLFRSNTRWISMHLTALTKHRHCWFKIHGHIHHVHDSDCSHHMIREAAIHDHNYYHVRLHP